LRGEGHFYRTRVWFCRAIPPVRSRLTPIALGSRPRAAHSAMPQLDHPQVRFDRGQRRHAIVESLLADVFQGHLAAGQRLGTQELAERFGVSHTPIREALIALAGIGVIDLAPNRGAVVRQVSAKDVREVCQVRRVLECEATRCAAGRIELAELEKLAAELKRLRRPAGRGAKFIDAARAVDTRLHDLVAASCNNDFLRQELSRLKILFRAYRDVAWAYVESRNDYRRLATEASEHLAIVEALLAGDGRGAARAMSRHIRSGLKYWSRAVPVTVARDHAVARDSAASVPAARHHSNGHSRPVKAKARSKPSRKYHA
jgi:DNA-binding GntR family transcriptional regulator